MLNVPIRLTRTTRSKVASGIGPSRPTIRAAGATPAQLTSTRTGPSASISRQRRLGRTGIGDVEREGMAADRGRRGLDRRRVEVEHRHDRTLGHQRLGRGPAQARGGAGDDGDLTLQIHGDVLDLRPTRVALATPSAVKTNWRSV